MRLNLKILFLTITITIIIGIAIIKNNLINKDIVNSDIYGSWDLFEVKSLNMTAQVTLTFKQDKVISKNSCSYKDYMVDVQAISPVLIVGDEIRILKSSYEMKEYSPGFLKCKASIDEGVMNYIIRNGNLLLIKPGESHVPEPSKSGQVFNQSRQHESLKNVSAD